MPIVERTASRAGDAISTTSTVVYEDVPIIDYHSVLRLHQDKIDELLSRTDPRRRLLCPEDDVFDTFSDLSHTGPVAGVLRSVRNEGDAALRLLTKKHDGVDNGGRFKVSGSDLDAARTALDPLLRDTIEEAVRRIREYHLHGKPRTHNHLDLDRHGLFIQNRVRPIERVGLCVPAGTRPLFSSLLMMGVPARIAGVPEVVVVTPPQRSNGGLPDPIIMAVASMLHIDEVYALGGAQAVGALAYGTETVKRVDKIVGPGNAYTMEAQRQVFGHVGVSLLPGPSEVVVLCDETADGDGVAKEILAQLEHGAGTLGLCITDCDGLAEEVQSALTGAVEPDSCMVILVRDKVVGTNLINKMAPEHVVIYAAEAQVLADQIHHAGCILYGDGATSAASDYFIGPNHILPTRGGARYRSPLSVEDFVKRTSVIELSKGALKESADAIMRLADAEGLPAHADAVAVRRRAGKVEEVKEKE